MVAAGATKPRPPVLLQEGISFATSGHRRFCKPPSALLLLQAIGCAASARCRCYSPRWRLLRAAWAAATRGDSACYERHRRLLRAAEALATRGIGRLLRVAAAPATSGDGAFYELQQWLLQTGRRCCKEAGGAATSGQWRCYVRPTDMLHSAAGGATKGWRAMLLRCYMCGLRRRRLSPVLADRGGGYGLGGRSCRHVLQSHVRFSSVDGSALRKRWREN
jgi:hypothetical protein